MGPITETVARIEMVEQETSMPWASPDGEIAWTSPAAATSKLQKKRSLVSDEYTLRAGALDEPSWIAS
jgi:hypothetical protein